jgi:hypothetical protein
MKRTHGFAVLATAVALTLTGCPEKPGKKKEDDKADSKREAKKVELKAPAKKE